MAKHMPYGVLGFYKLHLLRLQYRYLIALFEGSSLFYNRKYSLCRHNTFSSLFLNFAVIVAFLAYLGNT